MGNFDEIKLEDLVAINGGTEGYYEPPTEDDPLNPSTPEPIVKIPDGILW